MAEVAIKNPFIAVVGRYINSETKILHKCLIDGHEWYAKPNNILHGKGCPKCTNHLRISHEEYVQKVATINPNIEVLGKYTYAKIPILHKCKIHKREWMSTPDSILHGHGCYDCANEKQSRDKIKPHDQYVLELKQMNPDIIVIGEYKGSSTPILHKCLKDNYEWYLAPVNALNGCGCPQCSESFGERKIRQWLSKHNIDYVYQCKFEDCRDILSLPFDFYLPKLNICIEYDGKQHYEPIKWFGGQKSLEYTQRHDNIKNEYCKNNNIKLLRIPYYANIEEELNNFLFI